MNPAEAAAVDRWSPEPTLVRRLGTPLVVWTCRFLIERLNQLEMFNVEAFREAHASNRPLLTFSNHTSLFDDPWLVATFAPTSWHDNRWCATDALNFFSHPLTASFFSFGRGVPIVRGAGLDQPGFDFLIERLNQGDWVHIFPEGGRSRDPEHLRTPLKTGIGHLVRNSRPLLLPFHHTGMHRILPIGARWPRTGQQVRLAFGEVFDSDAGLADESPAVITQWAQDRLLELEQDARGDSLAGRPSPVPVERPRDGTPIEEHAPVVK